MTHTDKILKFVMVAALALAGLAGAVSPALAQITSVQGATFVANNSNTTTQAVNFVSAPTAGNLMIAICGAQGTPTISLSQSGWSTALNESASGPSQAIFYKIAGAGESSTVTCNISGGNASIGVQIYEYSGIDTLNPLDQIASNTGTSNSPTTGTTSTTTLANELLIGGLISIADTTYNNTWNNSFTERADFVNNGNPAARRTYGGATLIVSSTGTYSTGSTIGSSVGWRGQIATFREATTINMSGLSNLANGTTVRVAINNSLQAQTTTTISGSFVLTGVNRPLANDIVTVFADNVADSSESTAVAKYDGSGFMTGLVLNSNVLSIGSGDNQSHTITNLGQYDFDQDEDIMHTANSGALAVQGGTNSFTDETLSILANNTLTVAASESVDTDNMTFAGALTSTGASTFNVEGDWTMSSGTFTSTSSTVIFDGTSTVTSGSNAFNGIQIGTASVGGSVTTASNLDINGNFRVLNGGATTLNISDDTVFAASTLNMTNLDTFTSTNSTFVFDGTTTVTSVAGLAFNHVQIGGAAAGGSLTTANNLDINGTLTVTNNGATTFNVSDDSVSVAGNMNLTNLDTFTVTNSTFAFDGTTTLTTVTTLPFNNIQIGGASSGGTLTTANNLDINGALTVTNNGATTFNISGDTINAASTVDLTNLDTFTVTNSTFIFDGTTTLTSAGRAFNMMQIGSATAGASVTATDTMTISGTFSATNAGATTFDISSRTVHFNSNVNLTNLDTFTVTNSSVAFQGTTILTSAGKAFNNVAIGGGVASLTTADNMDINGDLTVSAGTTTFDISNDTISAAAVVNLTNLNTFTVANSTVIFDGTTTLTSASRAFNNVQIGGAASGGSVTTNDNMDVNGVFRFTNGGATTFNISNDTVFFASTVTMTFVDTFTVTNSTLVFDGTTTLTSLGDRNYNNVQIGGSATGGSLTTANSMIINGALTVTNNGATTFDISDDAVNAASTVNLTNLDTFTITNSTFNFLGTSTTTSAGWAFNNINIGSAFVGGSLTTADAMDINGVFAVGNGGATTFNISNDNITMSGATFNLTNLDTFTTVSSTVIFDSTTTLTSAGRSFNTIQLGTGVAGASVTAADNMDINGNVTVRNGAATTWTITSRTINAAGNVNLTNLDTFNNASSTFIFDGASDLTSAGFGLVGLQVGSATVSGSLTAVDNLAINGDLTVNNGGATTLNITGRNITMTGSFWTMTNLDTFTAADSTVIFDAVSGVFSGSNSFDNIQIGTASSGGVLATGASFSVDGTLRVGNGGFTAFGIPSGTFTMSGPALDLTNLDFFDQDNSTVIFDGNTRLTSAVYNFDSIQIGTASVGGILTLEDNLNIDGTLRVFNGAATTFDITGRNVTMSGSLWDMTNLDTFTIANSTVLFNGITALTSASKAFNDVEIGTGVAGGSVTTSDNWTVNGDFVINNGGATSLNISNDTLSLATDLDLTNLDTFTATNATNLFTVSATLTSNDYTFGSLQIGTALAGVSLTLADDLDMNGGVTVFNGGATTWTITNRRVNVGGNVDFTNLDSFNQADSTVIFDGTTALTSNAFDLNNVQIGSVVAGGSLTTADNMSIDGTLRVLNGGATTFDISGDTLTYSGPSFDLTNLDTFTSTGASILFDTASGPATITSGGGAFNNVEFDDSAGDVTWTINGTMDMNGDFTLTSGSVDLAANDPAVFIAGDFTVQTTGTFTVGDSTVTFDGNKTFFDADGLTNMGTLVIDPTTTMTSDMTCVNLTINAGDTLDTDGYNIDCSGSITINGTLDARDGAGGTSNIFVGRSWANNNLFIRGNSTVIFDSTSGSRTILPGTSIYNNIVLASSVTYTLQGSMNIDGTLSLQSGTWDVSTSNYQVSVAGHWINSGATYTPRSGTVIFDGDDNEQDVTASTSNFTNVLVTNTGTINFTDDWSAVDFTNETAGSSLIFDAGSTYVISSDFNLDGQAAGTRITLDSNDGSTRFTLNLTAGGTQTVDFVDVSNSESSTSDIVALNSFRGDNTDAFESTPHWVFPDQLNVYVWTGTFNQVTWENQGNWDIGDGTAGNDGYPNDNKDQAFISSTNHAITTAGATTIADLTIGTTFTGTLSLGGAFTTDDASLGEGNMTVNTGVMRTVSDAAGNITVDGTATIGSNGTIIMRRTSTAGNGTGKTFTANIMIINGSMHADGEGFDNSAGTGAGTDGTAAGGGAYGGVGGASSFPAAGGSVYGSATAPTSLGSGGGDDGLVLGGDGGGAINLVVNGTLTINGTLSSSGRIATGQQAGGGSGGTLVITTGTLNGNGLISAIGGAGTGTTATGGGGGGGGRIDLDGIGLWDFAGSISTAGGSGGGNGNASRGFAGTIDWPANFDLTIGGAGNVDSVSMGYDGTNTYNFGTGDITINSGGILVLDGDPTVNGGNGGGVTLSAGDITIDAGGIFSADELGFDSTRGAGAGSANSQAGGAAYGGVGGDAHTGGTGGSVYGSATAPVNLGSGGGHDTTGNANRGGIGGGALILSVTNTITVDGTLSARGGNGSGSEAGGASGGTISIVANTLTGSGTISVAGGKASSGSPATTASGGGGGGGRIDLSAITTISFEGDVTTAGGDQAGSGTAERGYGGTIDWPANSDLTIGGVGGFNSVTMGYDGSNSYNFDDLTINTGGVLTIDGDPNVNAGAGGGATITATSVMIETGGLMNAEALGFVNTRGSGTGGSAANASGGGHGGVGGAAGATPGGVAYDSTYNPINLGSGGGRDTDNVTLGGRGGGAIILSVSTTITVDGTIRVDGSDAITGGDGGGGSGGTVNITTVSITGTGDILADGGRAGTAGGDQGGGGAGGRIFIGGDPVNLDFTFTGNITVVGGSGGGGGGSAGNQGTIFIDPVISSAADTAYAVSAPSFPITTITYTNRPYVTTGAVGSTTDDIRVKIPAGFGMDWDSADLTATIGGAASAKISTTVTLEDADKTLVLNVTTALAASDSFTVSGLSFTNFSLSAEDNLELEVTNNNDTQDEDDKTISVIDAVAYTWTGSFNQITWENQGNWDGGDGTPGNDGYPDDFTDVAIIASTNDNITTSGTITVGHLRMTGNFSGDLSTHNASTFTIDGTGLALNSGTIMVGDRLDIDGTMTLDGTLDMNTSDGNMSLTGSLTIGTDGLFQKGEGTVTFDGGTTQVLTDNSTGGQDLGRIRISVGSGNTTLELGSSLIIEKARIDNAQTLEVTGTNTLTLTGTGTGTERPFRVNGNFTEAQGTVAYIGLGETEIEATTYYTLTLTPTGTTTYHLGAASSQTIRTDGTLEFGNGTDEVTITGTAHDPDLDVRGNFTILANTIYAAGTGTTTFNKGATQTFTDNTTTKQDLGICEVSANGTDTTLSISGTVTLTKMTIDPSQFITMAGTMTITGTGTANERPLINDGTFTTAPKIRFTGDGDVEVEQLIYNTLFIRPMITADRLYTTSGPIITGISKIQPQNTTAFELTVELGGGITFSNSHTISGNGSATAVLDTGSNSYAVASGVVLTIDNGATFNANSSTVTFNPAAANTAFIVNGTFDAGTSSVVYRGGVDQNIAPVIYFNLGLGSVADALASRTYNAINDFTVGGSLTVGNANSTNNDTFNASSRTITLSGTGTPFVITNKGVFDESTSRITYTGTGIAFVTPETYFNLTVAPGAADVTHTSIAGTIAVSNDLTIGDGIFTGAFDLNTNDTVIDVAGDVAISTNGTLIASNNAAFNVAGSWSNVTNGSFIHNNGTVTFDSADAETIASNGAAFFHVEFDDGGAGTTWQLAGTMDVDGTFLVTEGSVDLAVSDPLLFVAGNFTIQTTGTFLVGTPTVTFNGNLLFHDADGLTNMGTLLVDPTTTMTSDMTCVNLTIAAGDTLITDGYDIDCSGSITINGSLDASNGTDGVSNIFVGRSWTNNNIFISGNSTVTFDSTSGSRTITSTAATGAFYNVTFNGASTWNLQDNMSIDGTLRLIAGTVDVTTSDWQIDIAGNWINSGATFTPQNGTVVFDGTIEQELTAGASNFWGVVVTNTGTLNSLDDYSVENLTDVTPGSTLIFDAGSTYTINGILTLNGQALGTRVILNSSDDTTRFTFDVGAANPQAVFYVDVSNSEAAGSDITAFFSFDRFNNDSGEGTPQWVFPAAGPLRGAVMVVD